MAPNFRDSFPLIALVVIIIAFLVKSAAFIVTEAQQAIVLQFGRPVGQPIKEAGLHFKIPFIQEARFLDKRILIWDGVPNEIPTKDKKLITVDTTARWKIVDVLKFIQQVRTETAALSRLSTILNAETRDTISNYNLVEAVRNSNDILKRIEERKKALEKENEGKKIIDIIEEEVIGEIEPVFVGREALSKEIAEKAKPQLAKFGVELIDVQLRRISYHKSVEEKVYQRMISERKRIAAKIRSIGQGEKAKIEGKTSRDYQQIQSEAYKTVQEILGQAEAERASIYAKAYSKDQKFFEFYRSLQAYETSLRGDANFLLSADSDYLKYLTSDGEF